MVVIASMSHFCLAELGIEYGPRADSNKQGNDRQPSGETKRAFAFSLGGHFNLAIDETGDNPGGLDIKFIDVGKYQTPVIRPNRVKS